MRGAIPAELVKEAKGGEVHVDMEDHRLGLEINKKWSNFFSVKSNRTQVDTTRLAQHCNCDREEEFVREKVASKPFQGSGNVLGSIAPAVAPPAADASLDPKQVVYLCHGACTGDLGRDSLRVAGQT